jgi:HAD superfamily hydrolase (TIGR01459 family)
MQAAPEIAGLGAIAARYDALLCDVWGVVHDGRQPFWDACSALARFREERGPVALVSNSPRPSSGIPPQFAAIGLPEGICDAIVTSGEVTRAELAARAPGAVFKIGPERDERIYDGIALEEAPLEEADFISCTGLIDDRAEDPEQYRGMLARGVQRGLVMVCANPDLVVHVGDHLIPCAGALAEIYAELGGAVVMAGKPHPPIYRLAFAKLAELTGARVDPARVLAVGDGAATDIAGANAAHLDAMFITGGIHRGALGEGGAPDAETLGAELARAGVHARWAARALAW